MRYISGIVTGNNCHSSVAEEDEQEADGLKMQENVQYRFCQAVRRGDIEAVSKLLKNEKVNINEPDWDFSATPPLLEAASSGNTTLVRLLCDNGCDPNVRSMRGETALHVAASNRKQPNADVIKKLLSAGCRADVQENLGGETALHMFLNKHLTKKHTKKQPAIIISPSKASATRLSDFWEKEAGEASRLLIELCEVLAVPSNVNVVDHRLRTPLQMVASAKYDISVLTELMQIMLRCEPDLNMQNGRGETALHEALENNNKQLAVMLIEANADICLETKYHETALHIASRKNMPDIVALLLQRGCSLNVQDLNGNTALHLAAGRGYHQVVELLLENGRNLLNLSNKEGLTPLHLAVESGFIYVVQLLLKADECDLTAQTKRCETALDLAQQEYRRRSQPEMTEVLSRELQRRSCSKAV